MTDAGCLDWVRDWTARVVTRSSVPLESTWVEAASRRTHVLRSDDRGTGRHVICFPGWGTSGTFWAMADQLEPLAAAARVSLVDLPGQPGLTEGEPLPRQGADRADWVAAILDALEIERAVIAGASHGGFLAAETVIAHPDRAAGAVLMAPLGFVLPLPMGEALHGVLGFARTRTDESSERFVATALLGPQELAEEQRGELAEVLLQFGRCFQSRAIPPLRLSDRALQSIECPTLVLTGEDDPVFSPVGTERRARRHIPRLEYACLPRHGHAVELSVEMMERMATFVDALDSPSS